MSKTVSLLLILAFLSALCISIKPVLSSIDLVEDSWVSKASMQEARANFGIAVVNGKIFAFGGDNGSPIGNLLGAEIRTAYTINTTEVYDPATDTWAFKASMPTARALLGVAVYQSKVYCIGGYYGKTTAQTEYFNTGVNEVYDPATNTWETRAPMPIVDSRFATASVVNGKIYVISATQNQAYDPETNTWTTKTPPLYQIFSPGFSVVVESKIYFIGTRKSSDGYVTGTFIQAYDPTNDNWTISGESSTRGVTGTACATTGVKALKRIYFFDENGTSVYDPESGMWTVGASMLSTRYLARTAVVNDVFYVVGGRSGQVGYITMLQPSVANEQYTPFGYGTPDPSYDGTAPEVAVVSPENKTYYTADAGLNTDIALDFTVDEPVFSVHFVLDGGIPVEISGNTTIAEMAVGVHNVAVFGFDTSGNRGTSDTLFFTIAEPEPFPIAIVTIASGALLAIIGIGLRIYFKKREHQT